jgi:hypothetical protein
MVVYTYNPNSQEVDHMFENCWGCIARPCLKKKKSERRERLIVKLT